MCHRQNKNTFSKCNKFSSNSRCENQYFFVSTVFNNKKVFGNRFRYINFFQFFKVKFVHLQNIFPGSVLRASFGLKWWQMDTILFCLFLSNLWNNPQIYIFNTVYCIEVKSSHTFCLQFCIPTYMSFLSEYIWRHCKVANHCL